MFCGIVEDMAQVVKIEEEGTNKHFYFSCPFVSELKVDQSMSHNGVCLTVVGFLQIDDIPTYKVTAMEETLIRSNLSTLKKGDFVNIERSMKVDSLLDGHIVQGHVDGLAICQEVQERDGSWVFTFVYACDRTDIDRGYFCVDKGSVAINGVSLTACEPCVKNGNGFVTVYIIPYTFEHTNFQYIRKGDKVNIEFDILGKYISKYNQLISNKK